MSELNVQKWLSAEIHPGCKCVFPELLSWKEFCGQIEIDEAIDIQMSMEG